MSANKSKAKNDRRLGFRWHRKQEKAVSPIVATLILILIAVAAGAALYLWFSGWQTGVTKSVGTPTVPPETDAFTIGGSTTVYPLTETIIPWFEQNYTNQTVTAQQGGSVAGEEAYCAGKIDVAESSSYFAPGTVVSKLENSFGCSATLAQATVEHVVAVDAIVGISATNNPIFATNGTPGYVNPTTNAFSFNASTMLAIYATASNTALTQNSPGGLNTLTNVSALAPWLCGQALANLTSYTGIHYPKTCPTAGGASTAGTSPFTWAQIPFPAGCATPKGATGWDYVNCTFGVHNTNTISVFGRADSSGTQQGFVQEYLLTGNYLKKDASGNSCGTDNQLQSCHFGINYEIGNPLLASTVASGPNNLGFNAFGVAAAAGSGLYTAWYQSGNTAPVQPDVTSVLIDGYRDNSGPGVYGPWRTLEYFTDGNPAPGTAEYNYLNFALGPEVNQDGCIATGYISLYAA